MVSLGMGDPGILSGRVTKKDRERSIFNITRSQIYLLAG